LRRICIIGDSHVAALKAAAPDVLRAYPDREIAFFAAKTSLTGDAKVEGGALVAGSAALRKFWEATSGGLSRIEPVFDHYVVCGLGLKIKAAMAAMLATGETGRDTLLDSKIANTLAAATLSRLRGLTDAPVLLIAEPFPSHDITPKLTARLRRDEQEKAAATFFGARMSHFARRHGAAFMPQPVQTVSANGLMTLPLYGVGRPYLVDFQGEDDHSHMNAAYGAIVLTAALDLIG